ncbi:DUF4386 family protein [Micromonospora sp. RTGN7]|uniref:DUF4386 family protein n=1 Tax=Micromonospora sp. RTGN7 TaxID=3016526 RepID=UPI0029FECCCE|nr:DUF4386 family protein [Micromonospora sp. RTGN7]
MSARDSYRIGAIAGIAGAVITIIASLAIVLGIQDPFGMVSSETYMEGIAEQRTSWLLVHMVIAVAMLLKLAGMMTLGTVVEGGAARPLSRIGNGLAITGATLLLVTMARDGYVHAFITDNWAAAGADSKDVWAANFAVSLRTSYSMEIMSMLAFVGFAPLAYGAAMLTDSRFPRWLGLLGIFGGLGGVVTALILFLTGNTDLGYGVFYPLFVVLVPAVWFIKTALVIIRHSVDDHGLAGPTSGKDALVASTPAVATSA